MLKTLIMAFFIAVLAGMGIGSGGFLVIYLTQLENTPQIVAQGINLLFFIFSAAASTLFNIKNLKIIWRSVAVMSIAGTLGCLLGTSLAGAISGELLQKIFGGMLILSGSVSLIKMIPELKKQK